MILLDAAPSNDEIMGFVLVFGLLLLCFLIAQWFGPAQPPKVHVMEGIAPKGPVSTVVGIIVIIAILYFVGRFLVMAHQ